MKFYLLLLSIVCLSIFRIDAQIDDRNTIQSYLLENGETNGIQNSDVTDWIVTDQYNSKHNLITHVYIKQKFNGIEVFNGVANFNIKDSKVLNMGNRLVSSLASKINTQTPEITAVEATEFAAKYFDLQYEGLQIKIALSTKEFILNGENLSREDIPVKLVYFATDEGTVKLAWDLSIYLLSGEHWYSIRVDAINGQVIDVIDWVTHCEFGDHDHASKSASAKSAPVAAGSLSKKAPDSYNVYAVPVESPNHGNRTLVTNPAESTASPFGWHDTNGINGFEFTITRGNNVYASEDGNDDNLPGYSPDGGATLDFNFPLNLNQDPSNYLDPAITNLFYWNNLMHDVWYQYGFDEASGNFQQNNYGKGGMANDYVNADAQDGSGTNNANFATPPDGNNPRMQMYIWTGGGASNLLHVNSPPSISGAYGAVVSSFGPAVGPTPISADLVAAIDASPDSLNACDGIVNGASLNGKIAVIRRGDCQFTFKVEAAQNEGAIAVIIVNNVAGAPFSMGGISSTISIPSVMISQADGNTLYNELFTGSTVNVTLVDSSANFNRDSDLDNGVIAHEYTHGISNRLTGGPSNSGCLSSAEQMGEGWSDYFGMVMMIEAGDSGSDIRGVGTYASGQSTQGDGIRPAPYSTDFAINDFTYGSTNNTAAISQPHGIGFVWCSILWDMTWKLIDLYGFDPDLYNGTGGNNIAMQLVVDGLKLQPCNPGFVDGRDAIILADQILNGGIHECMIWEVFANRGLGASASQGSSASRSDQVEAFDIPNTCIVASAPPNAAFNASSTLSCNGIIIFEDSSTSTPQVYHWDFGDGDTSNLPNPTHTYSSEGTFTVTLTVSNNLGSDVTSTTIQVDYPDDPLVFAGSGCVGDQVQLNAVANDDILWFDANNVQVGNGSLFLTQALDSSTIFKARNVVSFPSQQVGPANTNFGTGGYHGTNFTGEVYFTAEEPLLIVSAFVDAEFAGPRDLFLWEGTSAGGTVLQAITVDIPFAGPGRIDLGFEVPAPGNYSIGGTGLDLYRNNSGASYPYTVIDLITLTGSSAGLDFYYYLYDLEVQKAPCKSNLVPVTVEVRDASFTFIETSSAFEFNSVDDQANSYSWDFGDGNTSTDPNPVHSYVVAGTYVVSLTLDGNCTKSDTVTGGGTGVSVLPNQGFQLNPNPSDGEVSIILSTKTDEDLLISIHSTDGKEVLTDLMRKGTNVKELSLDKLASAVYYIKVQGRSHSFIEKLVLR